jgi:hypothetical protein
MVRKNHPNAGNRRQHQKSKTGRSDVFGMFRPVGMDSAEELYELMKLFKDDGILPESTQLRDPGAMHVTYLEKRKLTRELQGFAQGFNTHEAIDRINIGCEQSRHLPIIASLGRVSLMDRRDETLVVRLDHNQTVADEYSYATSALRALHVNIRGKFTPHIGLVRVPGLPIVDKQIIAHHIQEIVPEEVTLDTLRVDPPLRRQRD